MICQFNSLSYPGQVLHHFTFWEWMNNPFRLTNFYYRCRIMSYPVLILCTKDDDFFKQVCGLTTKTTHNREKKTIIHLSGYAPAAYCCTQAGVYPFISLDACISYLDTRYVTVMKLSVSLTALCLEVQTPIKVVRLMLFRWHGNQISLWVFHYGRRRSNSAH